MSTSKTRVPLILGTMTLGYEGTNGVRITDKSECQKFIDTFKSHGFTELDTARAYCGGTTEELLAQLELSGTVLDSKCHPNNDAGGHKPASVRKILDTCLEKLQVKKLRIFYLHAPDRSVPFEDTLKECDKLYKEGKFEQLGVSNYAAWEVAEMVGICERLGLVKPTVYQGMYNALTRHIESEMIPAARKFGLRLVMYNPLAGGLLTEKIAGVDATVEKGSRFDPDSVPGKMYRARYINQQYFDAMNAVKAKSQGIPLIEIALRWMQHHSKLTENDGVIIGGSSVKQIDENCALSEKGPLPQEVLDGLDDAWHAVAGYAPSYWR